MAAAPARPLCQLRRRVQSTSTLLLVLTAELILFFFSLSRFEFSILQTKQCGEPHSQCFSEQGKEPAARREAEQLNVQVPVPGLRSGQSTPTLGGGGGALFHPLDSALTTFCPGLPLMRSSGHFLVPDSPQYGIFFGGLLGWLAGFSDHVSNFL